jgi:DNA-binding MarR family transcriptional regulator
MQQNRQKAMGYIGKLSNRIRRRLDALSFHGIYSGAQGRALHFILLHSDTDIFQKDIEEEFGLRPPTATVLLKKMEQNGLITREPLPYDARLKKIAATKKALKYREQVLYDFSVLAETVTKNISDEELNAFCRTAEEMLKNIP